MTSASLPRILASGAYERDNVGDLLFQVVSAHYATGRIDIDWAAPIANESPEPLGRAVPSSGALLSAQGYDGLWTVGGEVGATQRWYAYRTSIPRESWPEFQRLPAAEQDALMRAAMGGAHLDSPYIPRPSAFPRSRHARLAINSAGVAGIAALPAWRQVTALAAIREAGFVSVRDSSSSRLLTEHGVPHRLAPDLIHTIARVMPAAHERTDDVLVQISEAHVRKFGLAAWADALAGTDDLSALPVRLFTAGTAPDHDSVEMYERLRELVSKRRPEIDIQLSSAMGIEDRVREISRARLWLGSSLHGRIIASAYGVRRISIEKPKLDSYVETWDPNFPYAVEPSDVARAVEHALERTDPNEVGDLLADQAEASVEAAITYLAGAGDRATSAERVEDLLTMRVEESRELQVAAAELESALNVALRRLRTTRAEAERLDAENAKMLGSATWRVGRVFARFYAAARVPFARMRRKR